MFLPYSVDVPMERWPFANWILMGIMGMFLVFFPRNDVSVLHRGGSFEISSYWVIGTYLFLDLINSVKAGNSGVAYIVHLVGGVVGMGAGALLIYGRWVKSTRYEQNLLQLLGNKNHEQK